MLLAIDAGNTNIVFAIFEGEIKKAEWRSSTQSTRTSDEYSAFLRPLLRQVAIKVEDIHAVIVGSVVPDVNFALAKMARDLFRFEALFVGSDKVKIDLKILLDHPQEIGADRIVNAVSSLITYKPPMLIVDFGTATTFDVVDEYGSYVGGAIAPGVNLSIRALHMAAAKLPRIDIAPSPRVIGRNTNDAIQSGIYWGYVGLIEGMIKRIKDEFGKPMTVIATGGLAGLFKSTIRELDHVDGDLTLRGLQKIYERNC